MLMQKVTIMLMGLMCFSSISGFFCVCHGSDGHIALELAVHNHCNCTKIGETNNQNEFSNTVISSLTDHCHCRDFTTASNTIISEGKNGRFSTHKVLTANLFQKPISTYSLSIFRYIIAQDSELSSFYTPLQTVIILA